MLARLRSISKWVWFGIGLLVLAIAASIVIFLALTGGLGGGFTRLTPTNPTLFHPDGLSITLQSDAGSTRVKITSTPREAFMADQAGNAWVSAHAALPQTVTPLSPIFVIEVRGAGPLQGEIAFPNGAEPLELLDLYTWDEASGTWQFLPSRVDQNRQLIVFQTNAALGGVLVAHTNPDAPSAGVIVAPGGPDLGPTYGLAVVEGMFIDNSGQLTGTPAQASGSTVLLMVKNQQGGFTAYQDASQRAVYIDQLLSSVGNYDGLVLDFAGGPGYTDFVAELAARIHEAGKHLDITLDGTAMSGNYDPSALSSHIDRIWVAPGDNPAAYLPDGIAEEILTSLVGLVHRERIGLLVSALNTNLISGVAQPIRFDEAAALFGSPEAVPGYLSPEQAVLAGGNLPLRLSGAVESMGYDEVLGLNYLTYRDQTGQVGYVYFASPQNLSQRLELARTYGLSAVLIGGLAHPDAVPNIADGLSGFLSHQPLPAPADLAITWRVTSGSGANLSEESGGLNLIQFLWKAVTEPGEYQISAEVSGGNQQSERGSINVFVAEQLTPADTPTPTPAPRSTQSTDDTQTTPQPTPAPVRGTVAAGAFELGGQTHTLSNPAWMRAAGMTWVKFQHKWAPGDDPAGAMGWRIQAARQNGLKILLAIPGHVNPQSIDYAAYVEFVRGVAALGPDAIEIWNEQNLSVEWPLSELLAGTGPASYVNNMLAPAYTAIKSVNPNIMVIGGAPAPSGYWGATACGNLPGGGGGCSDLGYMQQMAQAGAANYMDCMGVHYNEGIIPPSQTSGDPRGDNYYTRYFYGMLNTYYSVFGKPVCFTELGYLSPEGYGGLPPAFAWASDTSVAEQAAWLAEAAVLASQSGKVRLMVVWNVDIFSYGNDPQGGYAIIRPNGQCPACDALAAVMP